MSETNAHNLWAEAAQRIAEATGKPPPSGPPRPVAGGCIHGSFRLGSSPSYFVKVNAAHFADSFSAEADALRAIAATDTVAVPQTITHGIIADQSFLALEFVEMRRLSPDAGTRLGALLAAMHRHVAPDGTFGWHRENTIGASKQPNQSSVDWATFFCEQRLGYQLKLAADSGRRFSGDTRFLDRIHGILSSHKPAPSLLHGDLWGGNAAADPNGTPIVFDPATYYGDRETDLAFTRMFGGFGSGFYEAYECASPLPTGSSERTDIYNLYHVLNHNHLFGGGYREQALRIMARYL